MIRTGGRVARALVSAERENGHSNKTAPAGNRGLTSRWAIRQEALVTISPRLYDTNTEAR